MQRILIVVVLALALCGAAQAAPVTPAATITLVNAPVRGGEADLAVTTTGVKKNQTVRVTLDCSQGGGFVLNAAQDIAGTLAFFSLTDPRWTTGPAFCTAFVDVVGPKGESTLNGTTFTVPDLA